MLNIRETYAQMGKISNNLEKHGEEDVTAFDIPITGITLTGEEVNALVEDPYADRWLFNTQKEIRESNVEKFLPLEMRDSFEGALVSMVIGETTFTFADARIKGVTLEPMRGGETLLSFSVRVRPEDGEQIVALIDYQNRQIRIDVQDAKVAVKGGRKQQELPLSTAGEGEEPEQQAEPQHPSELFEDKKKRRRGNGEKRAH